MQNIKRTRDERWLKSLFGVRYIWSQYLTTETHNQILCVILLASEVEDYSLCGYCYCLTKQGTVENEEMKQLGQCLSLRWLSATWLLIHHNSYTMLCNKSRMSLHNTLYASTFI